MHAYISKYMHACIHTRIHTCMHAYISTYIHACIHAYIHACIHTRIHPCMHACLHHGADNAYLRMQVRSCVCTSVKRLAFRGLESHHKGYFFLTPICFGDFLCAHRPQTNTIFPNPLLIFGPFSCCPSQQAVVSCGTACLPQPAVQEGIS